MTAKVTETMKRTVKCPFCAAAPGKPCRSSRIPGPNTFGGGWGGPPDLETAHRERRKAFLDAQAVAEERYNDDGNHAAPEAVEQMRRLEGCRWAAYRNVDLGHVQLGHLQFLAIGPGRTFEVAPERMPDTAAGLGWRYTFAGWVNLETGAVEPGERA